MTRTARTLGTAALLALLLCPLAASPGQENDAPRSGGFIQHEEITLLLLDVEAVGKDGRPLRGLTKKDFKLYSGEREWEIYSVDDLCRCGSDPAPSAGSGELPSPPASLPEPAAKSRFVAPAAPANPEETTRYILYFDFSQLQMDGRLHAMKEARRWVAEAMPAGAEAMLAGYSTAAGLRELTAFTGSRSGLLEALHAAENDRTLIDTFPMEVESRVDECKAAPEVCGAMASLETFHGRRSLRALRTFLAGVESLPGHKAVFLFQQNGMMFPGILYRQGEGLTQLDLAEEVGAAANQARATIYSVNPASLPAADEPWQGMILDEAYTLGLNLSDFTGGTQNHYVADLPAVVDRVTSSCRCTYRLGLLPSGHAPRRTHAVRVTAAGVLQDFRYRVRVLTDSERWLKKAQMVLANPSRAKEIPISAAIFPIAADGKRWDLAVQIYLDTGDLTRLPGAAGSTGEWEVGALLHQENGSPVEQMLGVYRLHDAGGQVSDGGVVHERKFHELPAGPYRIASFARDRPADLFGGTETRLELPDARAGGAAGPLIMAASRRHGVVPLSDYKAASRKETARPTVRDEPIPLDPERILRGDKIEFLTWICPGKKGAEPAELAGILLKDGVPAFKVAAGGTTEAGDCLRVSDGIDTTPLEPGAYAYELEWMKAPGEPASARVEFEIRAPEPGR